MVSWGKQFLHTRQMALWTLGCGKQPHPSINRIICLTAEIVCPILFLSLKEGPEAVPRHSLHIIYHEYIRPAVHVLLGADSNQSTCTAVAAQSNQLMVLSVSNYFVTISTPMWLNSHIGVETVGPMWLNSHIGVSACVLVLRNSFAWRRAGFSI